MAETREHAFAGGPVYRDRRPIRRRFAALIGRLFSPAQRAHRVESAWASFRAGAELEDGCMIGPDAWCFNPGPRDRIKIGSGTVCRGLLRRELFGDGMIAIGRDVYIGDGCVISCSEAVRVGDGAMLAHGVQVFDNNSHPLDPSERARDWKAVRDGGGPRTGIGSSPVRVGASAWLGFSAIILPGVEIGDGSIVGAGSVVTEDVPAHAICAGNPARVVGSLAANEPPGEGSAAAR